MVYAWIIIQREFKGELFGCVPTDWYIELPDRKIESPALILMYLNQLDEQGWEQVSAVGEHVAERTWLHSIRLFFRRLNP